LTRFVLTVAVLTLVYALALASFHPLDLLFGAALSAALLFVSRSFVFGTDRTEAASRRPRFPRRVLAFLPFGWAVFVEVLKGTWEVALVTLRLRPLERPGIVAVPIGERTPIGIAVWALTTGLTPGAFFVEVDRKREVALIHILDARDPEGFRAREKAFYQRYQSKVFP
jgi:multicomponent Na+:H+ antiporter subunit E